MVLCRVQRVVGVCRQLFKKRPGGLALLPILTVSSPHRLNRLPVRGMKKTLVTPEYVVKMVFNLFCVNGRVAVDVQAELNLSRYPVV